MSHSTASKPVKTSGPPEPRPYRATAPEQRVPRHPQLHEQPNPHQGKGVLSRLWPLRTIERAAAVNIGTQDHVRGAEAAKRVVKEGILDPRYKGAARRVTALMCSLPIAIYLSYELFERRFRGREQKKRPVSQTVAMQADKTTET